jgi:pimeloyl-ACP methyl ester carboxylesterase
MSDENWPAAVAEWKARGDFIPVDDDAIFVVDLPAIDEQHEPLLVLHGFPSNSFDWRHVVERLRAERRVVLFDFLGFGLSAKPDRRYSIRLHAETAEAVVQTLAIGEVALLSHDMGDTVAGELLARDIEGELGFGIERRVLTNGSIYLELAQLTPGQQLLWGLPDERFDPAALGMEGPGAGYRAGLASTFAPEHQPTAEELDAQWALTDHHDGFPLLPRLIRYLDDRKAEEARFTGAIEKHSSPLGVVWGDVDPVAVYPMTDRLLDARPGTPRITLEGVGHYPMIEDPGAFATAVLQLLEED